ncbi:MAG: hypothetical protein ABSF26_19630 [Thermoguttaceae bacterium]|jgi:hypothetical protein
MRTIRLIRAVSAPSGRGPGNGQFALQRALRQQAPHWLRIGGPLHNGEIPWFWCWEDRETAALCARTGQPFIAGPNVLFDDSRHPCRTSAECEICQAASCCLLFTESEWYRRLIEEYRGPANRAPIVIWPYPIDPRPDGPLPAEYDLLVYEKSGPLRETIDRLGQTWPRNVRVRYGRYRRERLMELARTARCCLYGSEDDRGPLALAEILLAGCPAVGIPTGAPFIEPGHTGVSVDRFDPHACQQAVALCHQFDREEVARRAAALFDTGRIVATIVRALEQAARQ